MTTYPATPIVQKCPDCHSVQLRLDLPTFDEVERLHWRCAACGLRYAAKKGITPCTFGPHTIVCVCAGTGFVEQCEGCGGDGEAATGRYHAPERGSMGGHSPGYHEDEECELCEGTGYLPDQDPIE